MATGTPPYDGNSSAEIVGKHLGDPVPVASDVNAKIPRWLSTVIVKCLAKKPEDRFQDADDVLAALDSGRTSGSEGLVGAHTLERQVRRSGQVRRGSGRLGWWVAGVLGAALVAGWLARRAGYLGPGVASVHNALVEPIEILSHGVPVDTVAPEATQRLSLRRGQRGELRWRLIRPATHRSASPWRGRFRRSRGPEVGCWPMSVPKWAVSATSRPSSRTRAHRTSRSRSTPPPPRRCGATASCRRVPSAPTSGIIASTRTPAWPPTTVPIPTSDPTPTGTASRAGWSRRAGSWC